ncbi:MAG: type IX secretion system membrane protein PorP/SprF [Cytophagaceae bacterium]|jgi:type IX secretion system PorP/SprF family membrane protein|nr:type IX secretion system membrane protein PorP/SprF [Cytophagaceae bacterium]
MSIWIGCGVSYSLMGQIIYRYPTTYGHFVTTPFQVHPAYNLSDAKAQVTIGNQELVGPLRRIRSYYFFAGWCMNNNKGNNKNYIGILASNERDGEYIGRSRICFNYSWHTKINSKIALGAGANLGLISYVFDGTASTAGGGDIEPDAALGFLMYSKKYKIGLSANQVFGAQVQPIINTFKFPVFYNFYTEYSVYITPDITIRPTVLLVYKSKERLIEYNIGLMTHIIDKFKIGLNYRHQRWLSVIVGVENIRLDKHSFNFLMAYNQPTSNADFYQSIELSISYLYNK